MDGIPVSSSGVPVRSFGWNGGPVFPVGLSVVAVCGRKGHVISVLLDPRCLQRRQLFSGGRAVVRC